MSDIKTLKGTIQLVEKDIQIPKRAGGSYQGTRITFLGLNGQATTQNFHQVGLQRNTHLATDIDALTAGDQVVFTYTLNDKGFREFISIKADDGTVAQTSTTKPMSGTASAKANDYTTGAIKGNSVTNAVNIAISKGDTSLQALKDAYELVISLHAYAEERGISTETAQEAKSETQKEAF